jgi:hypothetical protein
LQAKCFLAPNLKFVFHSIIFLIYELKLEWYNFSNWVFDNKAQSMEFVKQSIKYNGIKFENC